MKDDNKIIKLVYTFFLGLLLAIFIGVGVNTFYPSPKAPKYPNENISLSKEPTQQQIEAERKFNLLMDSYNENRMKPYNRNVSIITLAAAVVLMIISLVLERKKIDVVADGVMLGGLLTLVYSLGRSIASQDSKYSFLAVTIGLIVVLYLGYHRFVRQHNLSKSS